MEASRKSKGEVSKLNYYPKLKVLETTIKMDDNWKGHKAGQFAYLTVDKKEGAHPYTIASAWNKDAKELVFITKALGDHTVRLKEILKEGMSVSVEGPYGCFDFESEQQHQIWVGAGIGITPFIAKLKQKALVSENITVDLFHPTAEFDQTAIDEIKEYAKKAGVNVHVLVSGKDERLTAQHIRNIVPNWNSSSVWFCGPQGFGQVLKEDFISQGLEPKHFHQEIFKMR